MIQDESQIRAIHEAGNITEAANLALEAYGQEVFGFIINCVGYSSDSDDIFSLFCVDFWRGLPGFQWRSSLRTWAYSLARNATARHLSSPYRRQERNMSLLDAPEVFEVAERIRTTTAAYLRTTYKKSIRQLRKQLPVTDQMLLVLRVDRNLSWRDIAIVMESEHFDDDDERAQKAETRYRKRFERIKNKLRDLAESQGII